MKLTKGKVLAISFVGTLFFAFLFFLGSTFCYYDLSCKQISNLEVFNNSNLGIFFLFPSFFLFSLITYPLREETFRSWLRFAKWWVPMSMLLVLITPDGQSGGYMPSLIDKQVVAFLTSVVFIIISTVIIVYRSLKHAR